MRRGELWWAELAPRSGSEQQGRRRVIVISHDSFNAAAARRSVIVVPLSTAATQMRRGPTAVLCEQGEGGLRQPSVALCHQVTTLDRARLVAHIGVLGDPTLAAGAGRSEDSSRPAVTRLETRREARADRPGALGDTRAHLAHVSHGPKVGRLVPRRPRE